MISDDKWKKVGKSDDKWEKVGKSGKILDFWGEISGSNITHLVCGQSLGTLRLTSYG